METDHLMSVTGIEISNAAGIALVCLGVGFLVANLRILVQFVRFFRYRSRMLVTWPARKPPYYGFFLALGVVFGLLVFVKLIVQARPPIDAFGEAMMLLYYAYLWPMSLRIGRGLYEDGIWAQSGFVPYGQIGGLSWREEPEITLVIIYRFRSIARLLAVPQRYYAEVRRHLRDKIASHDIHFTLRSLDLGGDERERV